MIECDSGGQDNNVQSLTLLKCANFDLNYTFTNKRYWFNWLIGLGSKCIDKLDSNSQESNV